MHEIDFAHYVRAPRFSATGGLVLSVRLIHAAPPDLPANILAALTGVHTSGRASPATQTWTRMVEEPKAPRAAALLTTMFSTGLFFLLASYEEEWVHSRQRITRIKEEKLTDDLVELAGQRWLDLVYDAHDRHGAALGLDANPELSPPDPILGEQAQ